VQKIVDKSDDYMMLSAGGGKCAGIVAVVGVAIGLIGVICEGIHIANPTIDAGLHNTGPT
jgi:hypothetical protein